MDKSLDVIRCKRTLSRDALNAKLGKDINKDELRNLLEGIV